MRVRMNCKSSALLFLMLFVVLSAGCQSGKYCQEWSNVADLDFQMIPVDDVELAVRVVGEGEPLVMVIGYGCTMDAWPEELIHKLAEQYKVIMFDNRGMGLSTITDKELSIELMADDTVGLMAKLGIEKANVMGWSMGGCIAQEIMIRYGEKANKVVLYATDYEADDVMSVLTATKKKGENMLLPSAWLKNHTDPAEYRPRIVEKIDPAMTARQQNAIANWSSTYDKLSSIENDVLLLTGTDDAVAKSEKSVAIASQIKGSWLICFKNGGHGLMYQSPQDVAVVVLTFLNVTQNLQ